MCKGEVLNLFFQLIARRYERKSTIVTTKVAHDYRKLPLTHAILNDQNTSIVILLFFYLSLFFSTSYFFEIITIYAINKTIITASSIMFAANIPIPMPATTEPFAFEPAD